MSGALRKLEGGADDMMAAAVAEAEAEASSTALDGASADDEDEDNEEIELGRASWCVIKVASVTRERAPDALPLALDAAGFEAEVGLKAAA